MLHAAGDEPPALITLARALTDEDARAIRNPDGSIALALSEDAMATSLPSESQSSKSRQQQRRHSAMGPVLLSWATAATTLSLQALLTDQAGLGQDAAAFCAFLCGSLPGGATCIQDPALQHLTLYVTLWLNIVGSSFLLIPNLYPTQQAVDDRGNLLAAEVPQRYSRMAQHELNRVDCSYIALNTLCMPGFFYHFFCLLRSWGYTWDSAVEQLTVGSVADLTHLLCGTGGAFAVYMVSYEFLYYWWHRAMHELPALYTWVHKHHHQQTYPDRPAVDTFNTGCVESQLGLYSQLGVLWACHTLLGVSNGLGAVWFFTLAGWLSVLEHDKFERTLPFDLWSARDHHMHHAFVRCNYSPYSVLWDKVFGTFKPFEISAGQKRKLNERRERHGQEQA